MSEAHSNGSKDSESTITHRQEIEEKGDYLGRKPDADVAETPFDEERLVDEREKGAEPGGETEQPS